MNCCSLKGAVLIGKQKCWEKHARQDQEGSEIVKKYYSLLIG
jgi:hypothetical protein